MPAFILKSLKTSSLLLLWFILLTGVLYPTIITLIAQTFFSYAANGSLLQRDKDKIGSSLIGQPFTDPQYFWGRPSATPDFPYNAAHSSGSNLALSNPKYQALIASRIQQLQFADKDNHLPIPAELITSSGSGLDPDISPISAYYQVPRIAKARHIDPNLIIQLINEQIKSRTFLILGEPRVNVLTLNLALDKMTSLVEAH